LDKGLTLGTQSRRGMRIESAKAQAADENTLVEAYDALRIFLENVRRRHEWSDGRSCARRPELEEWHAGWSVGRLVDGRTASQR
jgi:hypothetical protein